MTLTFDLHDIQLQVMNAQNLKHVHTKFGQVAMDSLCNTAADGWTDGLTDGPTDRRTRDRPRSSFHNIPSLRLGTQ